MAHKRGAETHSDSPRKKLPKSTNTLYQPLQLEQQEIRLLIVEPGSGDDPIQCSFERCLLDDPTSYETISYVWGDATKRATIYLHGQELDVPASSADVLRRMRYEDKPRKLWLDAVCINQLDLQEKGQQVATMGKIYSNCTRNLIWLGEDDGSASQAISCIKELGSEMHEAKGATLRDTLYVDSKITSSATGLRTRVRGSALRRFYNSEWFSRVWVVQEAALAPQSICFRGAHEIDLLEVLQAALWVRYKADSAARLDHTAWAYAQSLADWIVADGGYHLCRPLKGRTLTALLASFVYSKAQDPRDHVFALSGLWLVKSGATELPPELTPDYLAELPDVLRRATRFSIRERGDLEMLKLLYETPAMRMPTWIYRCDLPPQDHDPVEFVHHGHRADAGTAADIDTLLQHEHILTARGFTIGKIATHLPELQNKRLKSFRGFLANVEDSIKKHVKDDSADKIIGVTLQAGTSVTASAAEERESEDAYKIYKRALFNHESAYPYHNSNLAKTSAIEQKKIASQFALSMTNACYNRKFFTTTSGHFGLGPRRVQNGDLIVVLYGSPFPVMLRPKLGELDGYEVIGVCYIYGIMHGEATHVHQRIGDAEMLYRLF